MHHRRLAYCKSQFVAIRSRTAQTFAANEQAPKRLLGLPDRPFLTYRQINQCRAGETKTHIQPLRIARLIVLCADENRSAGIFSSALSLSLPDRLARIMVFCQISINAKCISEL